MALVCVFIANYKKLHKNNILPQNMLELKQQLLYLHLPPNVHLFTADAVSLYTNILTHTALNLIGKHLAQYQ